MERAEGEAASAPVVLVLMGVSGSGKSTVGELLGAMLGWPFRDADSFHPKANIEKMSRGIALTDQDRAPWLEAIAAWIDERRRTRDPGIVSCSALKRAYRDVLRGGKPGVGLVYLRGNAELIAARMARRKGHFMPPALLESQFAALEEPTPDEQALTVSVDASPEQVAERIVEAFGLTSLLRTPPGTGTAPAAMPLVPKT